MDLTFKIPTEIIIQSLRQQNYVLSSKQNFSQVKILKYYVPLNSVVLGNFLHVSESSNNLVTSIPTVEIFFAFCILMKFESSSLLQ